MGSPLNLFAYTWPKPRLSQISDTGLEILVTNVNVDKSDATPGPSESPDSFYLV